MDESWFTQKRLLRWGGVGAAAYVLFAIAICIGPFSAEAERRANEILLLSGYHWAHAESHGRGVAILGEAPSAAVGVAAVNAVAADWSVRRAWGEFTVAPAPASRARGPLVRPSQYRLAGVGETR